MSRQQIELVRSQYDGAADSYLDLFEEVNRYEERVRRFLEAEVKPGQRWLEIGCGPGNLTADLDPSVEVTGIDLSPKMIELAQEARPGATYLVHDFHEPLPDSLPQFDGALAISCFEFCTSPALVLHHVARQLNPGARFLFSVVERRPTLAFQKQRYIEAGSDQGKLIIYCWSFEEIASAVKSAGFVPLSYEFVPGWVVERTGELIQYGWWIVERAPDVYEPA